jgi:hypothetical protein
VDQAQPLIFPFKKISAILLLSQASFIKEEFPVGFSGSHLDSIAEEVLVSCAMSFSWEVKVLLAVDGVAGVLTQQAIQDTL